MQQTNGVTTVISQEQSDLVTSATITSNGGSGGIQKDPIKNGKSVVITNGNAGNINKSKIIINNSKSSNNNGTTITTNNNPTKSVPNGRANDVIVTNLQHKSANPQQQQQPASSAANTNGKSAAPLPDARAKQVLKEAVDAVVNSFTKHTQGYGRGEFINLNINLYFHRAG